MQRIRVVPKPKTLVIESEAERHFCDALGLVAEQVNRERVEFHVLPDGQALVTYTSTVSVTAEQVATAMQHAWKADMHIEIREEHQI